SLLLRLSSEVTDMDTRKIGLLINLIEKAPYFAGRIKVTGIPTLTNVIHDYTAHDQKIFTPITMGIIMVILYILYRSFWGVVIPLIGIILPLIWTQAFFNINGNSTNFIVSMIPPLLLGIGLSACMYVFSRYCELSQGKERFDPSLVYQTVKELTAPTFLCQFSTIIGFASLGGNGMGAVRSFGLYASLGVLFTTYVSLFLVPSLILLFKPFNQRVTTFQVGHHIFRRLATFAIRKHKLIFLVNGMIFAIALYGISNLEMETSLIRFLPPDHEVIRKNQFVEKNLFGIVPVQLVLAYDPAGGANTLENTLLSSEICNSVSRLSADIRKIAEVDSAVSYVTLVQDYDREFSREKNHIPPSAEEVKDYLDFFKYSPAGADTYEIVEYAVNEAGETVEVASYEMPPEISGDSLETRAQIVDKFITRDFLKANLSLRVKDTSSRRLAEIFSTIEKLAAEHLPRNVRFYVTGRAYLWAASSEILIHNEYHDWLITTGLIFIMLVIYFRSLVVAAMALIPNLLPTFVLYGYMGMTGMPLTTVTGMIASVALGLAVDDTIHYTYELRRVLARAANYEEAIVETLLIKGSGIAFSSIVVAAGFSAPMASQFIPSFQFGALVCFSVTQALVFELFLTPSMWYWYKPFMPDAWK
ncbi:MAG TPA: MMPL family transporter, partial [Candidatus Wallbacteria bacterium]|nr:MMPL family transporter [Candidatus Wallbacteria bacterium]